MAEPFVLRIIAPDRIFYEGEVCFVEFNTTEGQVGIYARHIPMTNVLSPGVVSIYEREKTEEPKQAALHSGFVEILEDQITILAEAVEWPDEIDFHRAEEARIRAERRLHEHNGAIDMPRAELALKRALVRLKFNK